jgi:hypothetical protein
MDIEKPRRTELIEALQDHFLCFEEVTLRHALFSKYCVRADVVAIPLDQQYFPYALAFEVKQPNAVTWNYATWSIALHQAADYVYSSIEPQPSQPHLGQFRGRRISGAFIFPSPVFDRRGGETLSRSGEEQLISGALQLALHFRVGHAGWEQTGKGRRFKLSFGLNEVWRSDCGFCFTATGLITGKRSIGAKKIDIFSELDGIGAAVAFEDF